MILGQTAIVLVVDWRWGNLQFCSSRRKSKQAESRVEVKCKERTAENSQSWTGIGQLYFHLLTTLLHTDGLHIASSNLPTLVIKLSTSIYQCQVNQYLYLYQITIYVAMYLLTMCTKWYAFLFSSLRSPHDFLLLLLLSKSIFCPIK